MQPVKGRGASKADLGTEQSQYWYLKEKLEEKFCVHKKTLL